MLPILTFDEGKLRPTYGQFFDAKWLSPQETIVAIAWKYARMNALPGHVVAKQLARRAIDPYEGVPPTLAHVNVVTLAKTFAIPKRALRDGIEHANGQRRMSERLRFCTPCMEFGYHGVMHQRVGASRCPCHGDPLEERCRGCGTSIEYRLNAKLLGAPFACATCRRPYAGHGKTFRPQPLPPELRRAITRFHCNS
jgi:hypothetical protein